MIPLEVMFLLYFFAVCAICNDFLQRIAPCFWTISGGCKVCNVSIKEYHYCTYINEIARCFVTQFCWLLSLSYLCF